MPKSFERPSWDKLSYLVISVFSLLQIIRWMILPQFIDIYYHLLTAWGFIQAGGYSGWDFWQYAPVGRTHIYPPLFHLILAGFRMLGIAPLILAKSFEVVLPVAFLIRLWRFTRDSYSSRLAFFVLIALAASFSFYLSLINYLPATLAMILGLSALGRFLKREFVRPLLLLGLCFYTHISAAWFFALAFIFYGLFNKSFFKRGAFIVILAVILAGPVLIRQAASLRLISVAGISERGFLEFKPFAYLLAVFGLALCWQKKEKYFLFTALFLASLVFLFYPSRFFSAQGCLAVVFLSAAGLDKLYEKSKESSSSNVFFVLAMILMLIVSPTILKQPELSPNAAVLKTYVYDSVLVNMLFPERNRRVTARSIYFPEEYDEVVGLIKQHSGEKDIVYAALNNVGVSLSSLSGRASANALLPEIPPAGEFDPLESARIFVAMQNNDPAKIKRAVDKYGLEKIGENKFFLVYKNPAPKAKIRINRAQAPFAAILLIAIVFLVVYWRFK